MSNNNIQNDASDGAPSENEMLVVVSQLKHWIQSQSQMTISLPALHFISNKIRQLCNQAITRARQGNRKTVMDRDFESTQLSDT